MEAGVVGALEIDAGGPVVSSSRRVANAFEMTVVLQDGHLPGVCS